MLKSTMVKHLHLQKPLYFDYNATTPTDPRVLDAMIPFFTEKFGNASSKAHAYGWDAELAIENARKTIAQIINCQTQEIFFVSGGTEANNLAIQGAYSSLIKNGQRPHFITSLTEHKAVLEVFHYLEVQGCEVSYLTPDSYGRVSLEKIKEALRPNTKLVSLIWGNNEIGTLNNIQEIGCFLAAQRILFHTDAVQAFGQIPIDVQKMGISLMTLTAHKIYGPKGIGALFVRRTPQHTSLEPLFYGGKQEEGLRPGTLSTPLIVGLAKASEIAYEELPKNIKHIQSLRDELLLQLLKIPFAQLNGHPLERLPNNINITFKGVPNSHLIKELKDIALSTGSACSTGSTTTSHVLNAIGLSEEDARSTIRLSTGRLTTLEDVEYTASRIKEAVFKIKGVL